MKRFSLTLPSLLAGRRSGQPPRALRPAAEELPRARKRQLTEAEQRLLDQKVVEARQQVRAEAGKRYATICRLCDQLGQPHLATRLIEADADTGTDEVQEMADRILGARA